MVGRARFLHRAGYSVLLIDFEATGETKGDHITFGWKESRDALAATNFIRQIDPTTRVAIIGSSLGGVAALLATPPLKVDALVLEEVYPTLEITSAFSAKS
jgi:alpha/beta superfamily hydrolase